MKELRIFDLEVRRCSAPYTFEANLDSTYPRRPRTPARPSCRSAHIHHGYKLIASSAHKILPPPFFSPVDQVHTVEISWFTFFRRAGAICGLRFYPPSFDWWCLSSDSILSLFPSPVVKFFNFRFHNKGRPRSAPTACNKYSSKALGRLPASPVHHCVAIQTTDLRVSLERHGARCSWCGTRLVVPPPLQVPHAGPQRWRWQSYPCAVGSRHIAEAAVGTSRGVPHERRRPPDQKRTWEAAIRHAPFRSDRSVITVVVLSVFVSEETDHHRPFVYLSGWNYPVDERMVEIVPWPLNDFSRGCGGGRAAHGILRTGSAGIFCYFSGCGWGHAWVSSFPQAYWLGFIAARASFFREGHTAAA